MKTAILMGTEQMGADTTDLAVEVQRATEQAGIPEDGDFLQWAKAAAAEVSASGELVIRIVSEAESARLNGEYRDKPHATNVLSFPADIPDGWPAEIATSALGDLVICAAIVQKEAVEQGKPENAHWAHMTVHGLLHLCGYDHIQEHDAWKMEQLEAAILNNLGFADPYA